MAKVGKLRILTGFVREKEIILPEDKVYTIGRDRRRQLPIMSRKVSRDHAHIDFNGTVFVITDLGSKQGTLVNGKQETKRTLRTNDVIQIGDVKMQFVMEEPQSASPTPGPPSEPIFGAPRPVAKKEPGPPVIVTPRPRPKPKIKKALPAIRIPKPTFSKEEQDMVGKTIGDVRIIGALNKGRRTVIYKGIQDDKNRVVALKMLNDQAQSNPEVVRWLIEGAKGAGDFRHEDAVTLLGGGRDGSVVYVFSSFMDGGSAQDRFARAIEEGLPSVRRSLESIVHVARALEYAHSKDVLHLGVRPSKILFDEKRRPKLNGMGFDNGPQAPGGGMPPEVTAYVAPEQIAGQTVLTYTADIYALGASFHYMLTGRHPERDRRQRIPSPKQLNENVPDSICRIIEKMVNPAPERRYKSYGQLLHDVRWALRGESWPRG